jgi:hypothetical protein
MLIDYNGNVGIGTNSPVTTSARLSIKAAGDYDAGLAIGSNASASNWACLDFKNTNAASPAIIYQDQVGTFTIRTDGAYPITFNTNGGNERMRIDASGQLGIGFTPLATQGNLQVYKGITGGAPATTGTTDANQVMGINGSSVQLSYGAYVNGVGWIQQRAGGNFAVNYSLALQPNGGNVGIGTSSPEVKLEVGKVYVGAGPTWAGGDDLLKLTALSGSAWGEPAIAFHEIGSNIGAKIGVKNSGNGAMNIIFANRDAGSLTSTMTERARITTGGDLLVGMTSSNAYQKVSCRMRYIFLKLQKL